MCCCIYIHTWVWRLSVRPSVHPYAFVSQRSKCEKKKNGGADSLIQQPASQPAYKWMSICTFEVSLNELNLIKTTTTIIINIRLLLWLTSKVCMVWILKMNPRRQPKTTSTRQTSWNAAMQRDMGCLEWSLCSMRRKLILLNVNKGNYLCACCIVYNVRSTISQ